jgi:peptide/nickel transport system ATP-binding protein
MDGHELLSVEGVSVSFDTDKGPMEVVDEVSFGIGRGRTLALVGESGCGKSVTASSIMRLLPQPYGKVTKGRILFESTDVLALPIEKMYTLRGGSISMIFQEPMTALNPVHTAGDQIDEVLELHRSEIEKKARGAEVLEILRQVEMPSPEQRMRSYPFQLSGGMRQRVMIAMALAGRPALLIADEPTTALDVTVQAQILHLVRELQKRNGMGVLYITHDMGVVAEISDDVAVMYAGQIVESGSVGKIFADPVHPYTRGLIASMPQLDSRPKSVLPSIPGVVPSPHDYPATCRFAGRCAYADDHCASNAPALEAFGTPGAERHMVRCFKAGKV